MSTDVSKGSTIPVVPGTTNSAGLSPAQRREQAVRARNELVRTLDALEARLNLPRRITRRVQDVKKNLKKLGTDNPAAFSAIALGTLTAAGALVWAGIRAANNR